MQKPASETIPPPSNLHTLQAIMKLTPQDKKSKWSTFAYVLNRDILKSDGTMDDLYAMIFPLGSFKTQAEAETHAKNIILKTGHPAVTVAKYAAAVPLARNSKKTEVLIDKENNKIIELESQQYKHDKEIYEKRLKMERDLLKEVSEESDPESLEYFKRQVFLAVKNRTRLEYLKKELEEIEKNYLEYQDKVREHFSKYPEHEKEFLPYLKDKLTERGELQLYYAVDSGYHKIREELLGINENICGCGNCKCNMDQNNGCECDNNCNCNSVQNNNSSNEKKECECNSVQNNDCNNENKECRCDRSENRYCECETADLGEEFECDDGVCFV